MSAQTGVVDDRLSREKLRARSRRDQGKKRDIFDDRRSREILRGLQRVEFWRPTDTNHTTINGVTYKIADCLWEREEAFRLVYRAYRRSGLMAPSDFRMRVTAFHLLPSTQVFIAVQRGKIIYTVTLVRDAELGLPTETVYPDEIRHLRNRGCRLGEVSCLADDIGQSGPTPLEVFLNLNRFLAQFGRFHAFTHFLIAVRSKHERFYKRFLGFERIGVEKPYPSVGGLASVALCFDFARSDRFQPVLYESFFGQSIPPAELQPKAMSESELSYFRAAA